MRSWPILLRNEPWTPRRAGPRGHLIALCLVVLATTAFGCMEANPLPSPDGPDGGGNPYVGQGENVPPPGVDGPHYIARSLTYVSALAPEESTGNVVVVGEPGVASDPGELVLDVAGVSRTLTEDATAGFSALVAGVEEGTKITLTLIGVDDSADPPEDFEVPLELVVKRITGEEKEIPWFFFDSDDDGAHEADPAGAVPPDVSDYDRASSEAMAGGTTNGPLIGSLTVSAPDDDGNVLVVSGFIGVTPLATVVVFNPSTEQSTFGQAESDGSLEMKVPAQVGDQLHIFAVNPSDAAATTEDVVIAVPSPDTTGESATDEGPAQE